MTLEVIKRPSALKDIDEAAHYLLQHSSEVAAQFIDAVEQTSLRLGESPELGERFPSATPTLGELRVWQVKGFEKYLIFYHRSGSQVELVRVLHGAQDIPSILANE